MTNAEKFIGDEDLIDTFIDEFNEFACKQDWDLEYHCLKERLVEFFKQERTPTLTEDERVILRNINKQFIKIGRDDMNNIYFVFEETTGKEVKYYANVFDNVFQFIKERRRILY